MKTNKLVIGNMNYSSWSFRPWIAMRHVDIGFEEQVIPLFSEGYKDAILSYSPAGQVPVFVHETEAIWGSQAILEYIADRHPEKNLRPSDIIDRAKARSVMGEMHSGFHALRGALPMNFRRPPSAIEYDEDVETDIRRVDDIWSSCRANHNGKGPFLFGNFTIADAMYAPVISRFHVYEVEVSASSRAYMDAMMSQSAWQEWHSLSEKEPWTIEDYEL